MNVQPPVERPNESSGYLGYYTRCFVGVKFDLVDFDGVWPAVWIYHQKRNPDGAGPPTLRIIEEKPNGQEIHPSQTRAYMLFGRLIESGFRGGIINRHSGIYVIHEAQRLVKPEFPIRITKLCPERAESTMDRDDFDSWMRLAELWSLPDPGLPPLEQAKAMKRDGAEWEGWSA